MSEAQAPETETETEAADTTQRRSAFGRLIRDPQAVITATILVVIVLLGLLAPLLAQHDPNESALSAVNADPGTPGYLLGGDQSGRDIFARLLYSINTSVLSGLIGTSVAVAVGLTFGLIGGYFGGRTRFATEWLFNLIMTFPGLLLLIVLLPVTGGDFRATMLIFGVLLAPGVYRIVRNLTVGARNELYVDAARVSGLSSPRILRRQVMPTVRGPVIISAAFLTGSAIGVQSGLAFLGLGSTEVPSFGAMIADGFRNYYVDPLQFVWPAAFLGVLTSALVLFGNSLRDALAGARPKAQKIAAPSVQAGSPASRGEAGEALVQIEGLSLSYPTPSGGVKEVLSGVSLAIRPGETLGLVGESGSGKSQTAFSVLGLLPPDAVITSGSIRLEGRELLGLRERELIQVRGRAIAYVPQEPMSNLDPSFTIGAQLVEGIRATSGLPRAAAGKRALELLDHVGIPDPKRVFSSYPHQISGGMAQRVLIAGAVASRPRLLIADEPTTALDVTIQAEILDLLRDLQAEMGMAILMVTHNFGVVADICDRIAVMQQGRIVETGEVEAVFRDPQHPYTRMLLDSILDESHVRTDSPVLVAPGAEGPR
ncbi:dipeptide/oligopeptide/nickel ABC transporter permease/ATP-binding protein [Modestobacter sp. VKM Ac-2985]|uniref:dipeptide/oligopeptide/nickel ABC transporter permease/ATP-binding protein n=1 Tax=Modestobacter sp. VKM Ac-2985 TaxID=3004139 RepID=UPI0022AB6990|nr:dipeptide/oligopeptide/nickel ABC transporter permease/ATP-binding protein [Modestobacter sp. VKM Ac-2985]MCZ2840154.1 dipeptide/oligopeptide/nickel ABC transporter permease/ATP-binding protein [Modestobacter sp. VKM Ac-2985]